VASRIPRVFALKKIMNNKKLLTLGAIAALSAFAPNLRAANAEVNVKTDSDRPKAEAQAELDTDKDKSVTIHTDRNDTTTDAANAEKVMHGNKASGLLGMEVRNKQNEKLGEIKDVVLDLPSGKVSYAVLAVGGFLGLGEKLVALPPSAFTLSSDGHTLTIDADKSKIQAAPGFAATSWPSVHNPEMKFWNNDAVGSPGSTEVDRSDLQRQKRIDVDTDKDTHKTKIYTDADKDKGVKVEVDKK